MNREWPRAFRRGATRGASVVQEGWVLEDEPVAGLVTDGDTLQDLEIPERAVPLVHDAVEHEHQIILTACSEVGKKNALIFPRIKRDRKQALVGHPRVAFRGLVAHIDDGRRAPVLEDENLTAHFRG